MLEEDRLIIEKFNSRYGHNASKRVNLYHTPQPRLGPVTAPVVLLLNNPSYATDEPYGHQDEQIILRELESIKDENYPHLAVTPNAYWYKRFKELIIESGIAPEKLSRNICTIQFSPYRSLDFAHRAIKLPSQTYTFSLVKERLASGAIIIVMRGYSSWVKQIPELATQANQTVFRAKNTRCIYVSRNNLPDGVFNKISNCLRSV